jgi:geranylgeranyl pyrophosphate synthase
MLDTEEKALVKVQQVMREALGEGVLADMALGHLNTGGKYMRSRLALQAAHVLGVSYEKSVGWAAACELAHNATLVHDDVQDGDTHRRGKPTVWVQHGVAQAINVGDLLLMLPYSVLPEEKGFALCQCMASYMADVIKGQALEYSHTQNGVVDREAYMQAVKGKTAALFSMPVAGAALLAGCSSQQVQAYAHVFGLLGVLFQMHDDVLDVRGQKGREKPGLDIAEGKISALVVEHCALYPEEKEYVLSVLKLPREETPQKDIDHMLEWFQKKGALERVTTHMQNLQEEALKYFQSETCAVLKHTWNNVYAMFNNRVG